MMKTQNRDRKGKMRGWEQRLMAAIFVIALAVPAVVVPAAAAEPKTQTGGPVLLMGIDPEIGGDRNAHGPISTWAQVVEEGIMNQVTNGASGILVIGGSGDDSQIGSFWGAVGSAIDEAISYVEGPSEILSQSFESFAMIAVSSSECELVPRLHPGVGLSNAENDALIQRGDDIAAFVNGGGGLIGFTQASVQPETCPFDNPWGYIGQMGDFETITGLEYDSITPTAAGTDVGVSHTLNVCCWHDVFTQWPDFLDVLAWRVGAEGVEAAALGGSTVVLVPPSAPGIPLNVSAGAGPGAGQITVSWDEPLESGGAPVLEYSVFASDDAEGPFSVVGTVDNETLVFTESGLVNNATRHYRVLATNEAGDGPLSQAASATTFDVPGAPLDLTGDHGLGGVVLTWEPPMDDGGLAVTGYNVYAGEPGGGFSLIGTTTGTSFTEEDPPAVEQRSYRVTTVNEAGEGPGSDAITVELMILVDIEMNPENKNKQVNSNSRGNVRVAIYSTPDFDAPSQVDRSSLTFGATGDEDSLVHCHPVGLDVDGDGLRDLVCHFRVRDTGLASGDTEAVLKGLRNDGMALMGTNEVRVR